MNVREKKENLCGKKDSKGQSLLKRYGEVNSAYKQSHLESSH